MMTPRQIIECAIGGALFGGILTAAASIATYLMR